MIVYIKEKPRKIYVNENQVVLIKENQEDEGFRMSFDKRN